MSSVQNESGNEERGLNPADVQNVRFTRASMLRPGYVDSEVDRVMSRVAEELARHIAEKAALRDEVRALRAHVEGIPVHEAPSDQAAQEAAARMAGPAPAGADTPGRSVEELEEQVAYLKAFGSAVRVQLRSYLEALITDVESEWGRADPGALPQGPPRPPAQRSGRGTGPGGTTAFSDNTV